MNEAPIGFDGQVAIVTGAGNGGLEIAELDNYYVKGPKLFGYMFEGVATKS